MWRPIPSAPGYEVSTDGGVRSFRRSSTPRCIKTPADTAGYRRFAAPYNGKRTWIHVHAAVAEAFIGPRPAGMQVRHLDGNRLNNALSNLAYGTQSENVQDSLQHGTHAQASKTHCRQGHPFDEANTYSIRPGRRYCRACNREAVRRLKARKGAVA